MPAYALFFLIVQSILSAVVGADEGTCQLVGSYGFCYTTMYPDGQPCLSDASCSAPNDYCNAFDGSAFCD
ncbi:hypothetical protein VTO58DRAFT_108337 [Aureobasidium pullulans]